MEKEKKMKKNLELYGRYKAFSFDWLFYYAIIFLFFTQTKGINAADVLLAESLYPIFKIIFLIPATVLINSVGKRKSLIIGNFFNVLAIIVYIASMNFITIIIGELLSAIGFIIKGICESNILYDSLENNEKRGIRFAKIEGKSISIYYYLEAISSIISGLLFVVNGYIPMIMCLVITIFSTYLSTKFKNIDEKRKINFKEIKLECSELLSSFKLIRKSLRLKNLILFGAFISAIMLSITMLRSSIMQEIGIPAQYFGLIFAILGLISGITAKNASRFHKRFRNRTLAFLAIPLVISFIILGSVCTINISYSINVIIILMMFLIQYIVKGPFHPLIKQYLNNFTDTKLRTKISSLFNLLENLLRFLITFIASNLLRYTTTSNTFIFLGITLTIIVILMLKNMKNKVGLKPEEYSQRDIKFLN